MSEVDFLIKLRDACLMVKDACEERLDKLAPPGCERVQEAKWDPAKIRWVAAEGGAGSYERSDDVDNPDFKEMLKDLAAHKGKLQRDNKFYWLFSGSTSTVGRKQRKNQG